MTATAARRKAPVGNAAPLAPMYRKMLLNHPPGVLRMGNVALCTLETMEPTPMEIIMVPRVTMNGGIFRRETRRPLTNAEGEAHDNDQQERRDHREPVLRAPCHR